MLTPNGTVWQMKKGIDNDGYNMMIEEWEVESRGMEIVKNKD